MTLKGYYDPETSYSVGDVVYYQDCAYVLKESSSAGTPPTRDQEWERLNQELWDVIKLILDAQASIQPEEEDS